MSNFFVLGFLFGLRHALDADHISAVASIATRAGSIRETVRVGLAWGVGHALTLFVVCGAVLTIDARLNEDFGRALEFLVGIMLVGLGLDVVRRVVRDRIHAHAHRHCDHGIHFHVHSHGGDGPHVRSLHAHDHPTGLPKRAVVVGLMHGLAGSAGLLLLSVGTAETAFTSLIYVALFGIGSMLGMGALSLTIALPLKYGAQLMTWSYNAIHAAVGIGTVVLGVVIMAETVEAAWAVLAWPGR